MKKKLIEARELAFNNADAIAKLVETENRTLTEEEQTNLRGFHAEIEELDEKIKLAEKQEQLRASASKPVVPAVHGANPAQSKEEKKIIERYDFHKALRHLVDPTGNPLEGVEKEMDQEARREQKEVGVANLVKGGINIPSFAMREGSTPVSELRANEQVAGTNSLGGFTIGRDLAEVIGVLRPALAIRQAGARMLTGLSGNVDFSTQATGAATNWATEIASAAQSHSTFTQATMTPHRLAAWTDISLQLLAQSSIDMQQFTIGDINDAINYSVELAAFVGTGVAPVPTGIIGEVPEIELGTNGAAFTFEAAVDMETKAHSAYNYGPGSYIVNSKTYGALKKTKLDAGSGLFTIAQDSAMLNGKMVYISDALPSDLTKGSGTGLSAAVYGNFNDLLLGNWGGANIVVDQNSKAKEGMITIVTNTFWDILARRLSSFVAVNDIVTA